MPDVQTPKAQSPPCGQFPEGPHTAAPVCMYSFAGAFQRPAGRSSTRGGQIECGGLPAISTFQRHSTQHPSIIAPLPVLSCSCKSMYVGCVQRTGCSACGLGHPHQVLVGSPHVHISRLVPVSFAGFLIKCLHFISTTWTFAPVRPHVALRGRLRAVWALFFSFVCAVLPPFFVFFFLSISVFLFYFMCLPPSCGATRLCSPFGIYPPVGCRPRCLIGFFIPK
jgi:hypothetical protein